MVGYEYRVPKIPRIAVYTETTANFPPSDYDTVFYNSNTGTYESLEQKKKIEMLEKQLKEKEVEREKSLQSIIAYFYKRN